MANPATSRNLLIATILIIAAALLYWFVPGSEPDAAIAAPPTKEVRAESTEDKRPVLMVVGDSLSAGYGLADTGDGWVALLQQRLDTESLAFRVVNASISGDTSNGGAARLPAALATHSPAVVVIELGGNDGLRGLPLNVMRSNFVRMIEAAQSQGAEVILLGMMIPPNYGERYTTDFQQQFVDLSEQYDLTLVPFFLENVALSQELMQSDGIHPNANAQPIMLNNVWPALAPIVERIAR
ncbi:MAG: arylesterase [Woeseiaceae bacterium]